MLELRTGIPLWQGSPSDLFGNSTNWAIQQTLSYFFFTNKLLAYWLECLHRIQEALDLVLCRPYSLFPGLRVWAKHIRAVRVPNKHSWKKPDNAEEIYHGLIGCLDWWFLCVSPCWSTCILFLTCDTEIKMSGRPRIKGRTTQGVVKNLFIIYIGHQMKCEKMNITMIDLVWDDPIELGTTDKLIRCSRTPLSNGPLLQGRIFAVYAFFMFYVTLSVQAPAEWRLLKIDIVFIS